MPEDAVTKENFVSPPPQEASPSPAQERRGISRRQFLKRGGATALAAAGATIGLPTMSVPSAEASPAIQSPEGPEDEIAKMFQEIKENMLTSKLTRHEKGELLIFLGEAQIAYLNLSEVNHPEFIADLKKLMRRRLSNPHINLDEQIPTLMDQKIFEKRLEQLRNVNWQTTRNFLKMAINQIIEGQFSKERWREWTWFENLENMVYVFSRMGTLEDGGITEISVKSTDEKASKNFFERQRVTLQRLPIPNSNLVITIKPRTEVYTGGSHGYPSRTFDNFFSDIYIGPDTKVNLLETEEEATTIAHETGHSLDPWLNPSIFLFTTIKETQEVLLLRERAAQELIFIDPEFVLAPIEIRGQNFDSDESHIQRLFWFNRESRKSPMTEQEFQAFTNIYGAVIWRDLMGRGSFTDLVPDTLRNLAKSNQKERKIVSSWRDFLSIQQEELAKVRFSDRITHFIFNQLDRGNIPPPVLETRVKSAPLSSWWGALVKRYAPTLIAHDFVKQGLLFPALPQEDYRLYLNEALFGQLDGNVESFADQFATYFFQRNYRQDNLDRFSQNPSLTYFRRISEILGKKGVVMHMDQDTATALIQRERQSITA